MSLKYMLALSLAAVSVASMYTSPARATACAEGPSFSVSNVEVEVEPATDCLVVTTEVESGCDDELVVSIENNCQVPLILASGDFQCDPTDEEVDAHGGVPDPIDCSTLPVGRVGKTQIPVSEVGPQEHEFLGTLPAAELAGEATEVSIRIGYEVTGSERSDDTGCSVSTKPGRYAGVEGLLFGAVGLGLAATIRRLRRKA